MKLVELLAKELKKWPDSDVYMVQDPAREMDIWSCPNKPVWEGTEWGAHGDRQFSCVLYNVGLADDHSTAIVTREQWQAERDRQKGGEWKRHRGGKCPVADRVQVEVKFRDGDIRQSHASDFFGWKHGELDDKAAEVMQYRVISQPQAEEPMKAKFDGVKLEFSHDGVNFSEIGTARIDNICDLGPAEPQWQQSTGPLAWRDTIIHCQAIIEDFEREIERNVALLDSEGLFMQLNAKKGMQAYDVPAVDMGGWRNWQVGDMVSVANDVDVDDGEYAIIEIEHSEYEGDMPVKTSKGWPDIEYATVEFIRRP